MVNTTKRTGSTKVAPATIKYKKYSKTDDPLQGTKRTQTQLVREMLNPVTHEEGWRPRPRIIELLNMADFTHQTECALDVDEPIFQPFPPEVTFFEYEPFEKYEALLCLRNNDRVARRVKVVNPDSPFFSVERITGGASGKEKLAPGMEVQFKIKFCPNSKGDFNYDLVVCTEREKFVVPLSARGERAVLNFPDRIEFEPTPTRSTSRRTFIVSNIGAKPTRFELFASSVEFVVAPSQGILSPGETLQCSVEFCPRHSGQSAGEMQVLYESGETAFTQLVGDSHEMDAGIDTDSVVMLPTFVTRSSQKNLKLINNTGKPVKFAWKGAPTEGDDGAVLQTMAEQLRTGMVTEMGGDIGGDPQDDELSDDSADEDFVLTRKSTLVARKYKKLSKAADLDKLLFQDDYFVVSPLEGTVPPYGHVQFTVGFSPDHQREFTASAYCEVEGRAERQPLSMRGLGQGPSVIFSYDVLDLGDVYINTLHQYEVQVHNRGEIDAPFRLQQSSTMSGFAQHFEFEPTEGTLAVGESAAVRVKLLSNTMGSFDEVFPWTIQGSAEELTLQFRGRVTGPEFEMSPEQLEFGIVSYSFRYTKEFVLSNVCEIPFDYTLRIPLDGKAPDDSQPQPDDGQQPMEFQILPSSGRIMPGEDVKVTVEMCSETVMQYTGYEVVMDVKDVGDAIASVPIIAECCVPKLSVWSPVIDFGECYLRYPYRQVLKLFNESGLPARFEVLPQDEKSATLAAFTAEPAQAGIPAQGAQMLEFLLNAERLGRIQIPVRIKTIGSRMPPLECAIECFAMGPRLTFQVVGSTAADAWEETASIDFGKVHVLKDHSVTLRVYNPTLIPAEVKAFVEGKGSMFEVDIREFTLDAGAVIELCVGVNLDEVQPFTDVLHLLVTEGADNCIPLNAIGIGNTCVCEELQPVMDQADQFTLRAFSQTFWLHNDGRKAHSLVWTNQAGEEELARKNEYIKLEKKMGKDGNLPPFVDAEIVWKVDPPRLQIPAKSSAEVTITGYCSTPGQKEERLTCTSVPQSGKGGRVMFDSVFKASVTSPLLQFDCPDIRFEYWYVKGVEAAKENKIINVKNVSPLPLTFTLSVSRPFEIDQPHWTLASGEDGDIQVSFDPMYKRDLRSHAVNTKILVRYTDNPQQDSLPISSDINFPNVHQSTDVVNFGNCLMDTKKRSYITLTNTSKVPAVYKWVLLENDEDSQDESSRPTSGASTPPDANGGGAKKGKKGLPNNQVFDIMPIYGILPPGDQIKVEFSYFAYGGFKAECEAVLEVEGGPYCNVKLSGESSIIQYTLEPRELELGQQLYDRTVEREIVLWNQGRVAIQYDVNTLSLSRPGVVVVLPTKNGLPGTLPAGQKETLRLKVRPGIPEMLNEVLLFEIGPFEPVAVKVNVEGVYGGFYLTIPRAPSDEEKFMEAMEQAQHTIGIDGPKLGISPMPVDRRARSIAPTARPGSAKSKISMLDDAKSMIGDGKSMIGAKSMAGTMVTMGGPSAIVVETETEAERLMLCGFLLEKEEEDFSELLKEPPTEEEMAQIISTRGAPADGEADASITNAAKGPDPTDLADFATRPGRLLLQKRLARPDLVRQSYPVTLSEYCLDLGFVVKGTQKVRKFKLQNTSTQQVTFQLSNKQLGKNGITINPEGISKMAGSPEFPVETMSLTLNTGVKGMKLGPLKINIPLQIKGGPTVRLTVKANLMIPDLTVTRTDLNFGPVQTGCCRVITVQFFNPGKVAADWSVKKPMELTKNRDWNFFTAEPPEAILPPGEKLNVKFIFTPIKGRSTPYNQIIPVKIANNPRPINFSATATGYTLKLQFDPPFVDCGPILPMFEEQKPNEALLKLINPSPYPIEVFNLDFDEAFNEQDQYLIEYPGYPEGDDTLLLDPLEPGEPFYPFIVKEVERKREMERAAAEAEAAEAEAAAAAAEEGGAAQDADAPMAADNADGAADAENEVGDLDVMVEEADAEPPEDVSVNVLVFGPPTSGVSTQAKAMSERYGVPLVTVDELIQTAMRLAETPEEQEELKAMLPQSPDEPAPEAEGKDKKGAKDKKGKPEADADATTPPGFLPPAQGEALLAATLPKALADEVYAKGFVVDAGAMSTYIWDASVVASGILKALGLSRSNADGPMDTPEALEAAAAAAGAKGGKGGKGGKGKGEPEEEEPPKPFWWEGKKKVHVVKLGFSEADALARVKASLPPAENPEVPEDTVMDPVDEAAALPDEAAAMATEEATTDEAKEEEDAEPAPPPETLETVSPELHLRLQQWLERTAALDAVFGSQEEDLPATDANVVTLFTAPAGAGTDVETVTLAVAGIRWVHGELVCVLPGLDTDRHLIPSDYTLKIIKRPAALREKRKPITHFKLFTPLAQPELGDGHELQLFPVPEPEPEEPEEPEDPKAKKGKDKDKGKDKGGKKGKAEPEEEVPQEEPRVKQYRWVVPPKAAVHVVVKFQSPEVGKYNQIAGFDVLGGERNSSAVLSGICAHPTISTDYRNVFLRKAKTRPQSPLVNRQWIINRSNFEFGPLLSGKSSEGWEEGQHPDNRARMRITNNGHFDLHVEFKLKSTVPELFPDEEAGEGKPAEKAPAKKDKGGKKGDKGGASANSDVILLDPLEMDIKIDETQELFLHGFPALDGPVEDAIVAIITDNPAPAVFPVALTGDTPKVEIDVEMDDKGNCKGLQFDKLLLDKVDHLTFNITNVCLLPVNWKLAGCDALPEEFTVTPESGVLSARSTVTVTVQFKALEKKMLAETLTLEVQDVGEILPVTQSIPIPIAGEAYKIEVDVKFPEEGFNGIDFGTVKVVDDDVKTISIVNTGKYEIGFQFNVRRQWVSDLFEITPKEGRIPPGGKSPTTITLHFNKERQLKKEIALNGANDITMSIIEVATDLTEETVPMKTSVRAVYNKYSITPARGIVFGPHTYNTLSNPRTFTITNHGEFDFDFKLFKYSDGLVKKESSTGSAGAPAKKPDKGGKGGAAAAKRPAGVGAPSGEIELGNFKFEPAIGTVPVGTAVEINVVFNAEGAATFLETLGIDITDRDYNDQPDGIPYEVTAESCIPGIVTEDTVGIFEEHNICSSLDPFLPVNFEYATRDNVFNFGAVIADLSSSASDESLEAGGAMTGVKANLKISNPIKVPCTVNFAIKHPGAGESADPTAAAGGKGAKDAKPKGGAAKGGAMELEPGFPMEVHPKKLDIPPHEYRYVTVYFAPKAIKGFAAMFEAQVENGSNPKTRRYTCLLRGEGTLPTLTLEQPTEFNADGQPFIKFPRILRAKKNTSTILLKNNGIIPATGRIDFSQHQAFKVEGGSRVFTLEPHKAESFTVVFNPREVGEFSHAVGLKVQQNPFENYQVALTGESYMEDIVYERLPGDHEDQLHFPDGPLGSSRTVTFTLRNLSDKHYHFEWPEGLEGVAVSPAVGHLHAKQTKEILVTFQSDSPLTYSSQDFSVKVSPITYPGEPQDWDDRMTMVQYPDDPAVAPSSRGGSAGSGGGRKGSGKGKTKEKGGKKGEKKPETPPQPTDGPITVVAPEPECTHDSAATKALPLTLFAVADMAKPECDRTPINFRPTMMFQTRAFTFPLQNTSTAQMDFKMRIATLDGETDVGSIYEVKPEGGVVEAGGSVDITVRFSPLEVVDARRLLVADIPNLEEGVEPLTRQLNGRILRPWCHFEMPDSDYLSSGRRNPDMKGPSGVLGPLDPATRVVEFESLGTKVRNVKRFFVLNPTSMSYEFFWEPQTLESGEQASPGPFRCLTRRGVSQSGKRYEMSFEYTPDNDELQEGFWQFRIPDQNITVPFLLVGHVKEPRVSLDRPGINFGKVLVGAKMEQTLHLINSENIPFTFLADKSTYEASRDRIESTGEQPVVQFSPSEGTVLPNSSLPITVSFKPGMEKLTNYNVVLTVRKKPTRLALNVKGEGYVIHDVVTVDGADGSPIELDPTAPNSVDFGQVIINQRVAKSIAIVNTGEINYDFDWKIGTNPRLSIKPEMGTVPKGERVLCELCFHSSTVASLDHYPISLKIRNGNKYQIQLSAVAHKPKLNFSFYDYDFGPTFIHEPGMTPTTTTLLARNDDTQNVSFDLLFENSDSLSADCSSTVLAPGETKAIKVTFHPAQAGKFEASLPFEVNGLYTVNVNVRGEGVPLKLEVAPPSGPVCNFGSAKQGAAVPRTMSLRNASKLGTVVSFEPVAELLAHYNIETIPSGEVFLKARETAQITLYFRPQARTRQFAEDFTVRIAGLNRIPFRIQGACLGTELTFATDSMPFPPVTHGSRATKRLQVENSGDVGTKFSWDVKAFGSHFTVFPAEGFLAPGQDTKLEVTFHPGRPMADIRVERVRCKVEGGADCFLTLTGSCVEQDGDATLVEFGCPVRKSDQKTISIHNSSTTQSWQLQPVFRNDIWSGAEFLSVPPQGRADYPITFKPVTMATSEAPHEGTLFFPLPDGTGLLYRLTGAAEEPLPEATMELDVEAKSRFSSTLKVTNWLPAAQRFRVITEATAAAGGDAAATTITGAEYIDVPAFGDREYKYSFYAFKEGVSDATITFKNEATGEYMFYVVKFKAAPAGVRGTLQLGCAVRQLTSQRVRLDNPLDHAVTFTSTSTDPQLQVPASLEVPPGSFKQVEVAYRPLLVGESRGSFTLESPELGVFKWDTELQGVPTPPENGLTFSIPLGGSDTQVFRFTHWLGDKADYKCSFRGGGAGGCFGVQATVSAPAPTGPEGESVTVSVTFEPTRVAANFSDVLIVENPAGGTFECPVKGRAEGPRPQGPIEMKGGSAGSLAHKNVFLEDAEFFFSCDNPAFTVKPSEVIKSKQSVNVSIAFKEVPGHPRTGKLTISCPQHSPSPWVYYLRAT